MHTQHMYAHRFGKLVFCEGPLVRALRGGHWLVLDELNLAPSEVLEMLNRLLTSTHTHTHTHTHTQHIHAYRCWRC